MFSVILGIVLGAELLHPIVTLFLTFFFLRTAKLCPNCLYNFAFPPAAHEASDFSTSLPTFVIVHGLDHSHSSEREVVSHGPFDLHLLDI